MRELTNERGDRGEVTDHGPPLLLKTGLLLALLAPTFPRTTLLLSFPGRAAFVNVDSRAHLSGFKFLLLPLLSMTLSFSFLNESQSSHLEISIIALTSWCCYD